MAEQVNLRLKQNIKGNKLSKGSSIRSRFKMRLTLPADVVINIKTKSTKSPVFKKPQTENTNTTNTKSSEVKSDDKK